MPRRSARAPLPEKTCAVCGRAYSWRKKWARCWDEVKVCSERCRRGTGRAARSSAAFEGEKLGADGGGGAKGRRG